VVVGSVIAPPRPPLESSDPLEALIREARRRQRRRRAALAAALLLAAGGTLGGFFAAGGGGGVAGSAGQAPPPPGASPGARRIEAAAARATIVEAGISSGVGWAMNGLGLWLTNDGGRTWLGTLPPHVERMGDAVARILQVEFADRRHGWLAVTDVRGGVSPGWRRHMEVDRTSDGGRTWQWSLPPGCGAGCGIANLSFVDARHGWALVGSAGRGASLYATADGGRRWSLAARPPFDGQIAFLDARRAVAVGVGGSLWRTRSGGRRWRHVPVAAHVDAVRLFGEAAVAPARVGRALVVETSADAGATWTPHASPVRLPPNWSSRWTFSAASPRDWVATAGRVLWTTSDAGRSWRRIRPRDLPPGATIWSLTFTSARDGWAIFGLPGDGGAALVRTRDGGRTWSPLAPPAPRAKPAAGKLRCGSACRRP
jgi:photosystem II stability/assembly factor-like uncharacterized protein